MARKQINVSKGTVFGTLLTVSLIFFVIPHDFTKGLNFLFDTAFSPLLRIGKVSVPRVFRAVPSSEEFVSRAEYNRLLAAYDNVWSDLRKEHKLYEKLAGIRAARPKEGPGIVLAEVINTKISSVKRELVVNQGQANGLEVGQYVLGENAIVGIVSETSRSTSRIRLLTDVNANIPVWIWRPPSKKYIQGWMKGTGTEVGKIPLISTEYDVKDGDTVYAAARVGYLETARVIGKVTGLKSDEKKPLIWDITVEPLMKDEDISSVAVIVMNPGEALVVD
ncbi:hypothetical protein LCGC14_1824010 [marine sediment metagenome]|uniref:Cell shape-determining protein MreC n=1 Tax=marine sediment metagenome TaxID=412755 RepID=A0A0F9IXT5_9ZZZZ|nr:hypothetical protein [Phycisphaerales bacterium]